MDTDEVDQVSLRDNKHSIHSRLTRRIRPESARAPRPPGEEWITRDINPGP